MFERYARPLPPGAHAERNRTKREIEHGQSRKVHLSFGRDLMVQNGNSHRIDCAGNALVAVRTDRSGVELATRLLRVPMHSYDVSLH